MSSESIEINTEFLAAVDEIANLPPPTAFRLIEKLESSKAPSETRKKTCKALLEHTEKPVLMRIASSSIIEEFDSIQSWLASAQDTEQLTAFAGNTACTSGDAQQHILNKGVKKATEALAGNTSCKNETIQLTIACNSHHKAKLALAGNTSIASKGVEEALLSNCSQKHQKEIEQALYDNTSSALNQTMSILLDALET